MAGVVNALLTDMINTTFTALTRLKVDTLNRTMYVDVDTRPIL